MDQEPTNLRISIDDAAAARITAWVLGEASAFEAEQLEELCRTNPEWRRYEQSRRALHGFIAEAEKPIAEEEQWKISPEKRGALLEKISQPTKSVKKLWKVSRQSLVRAACITVFFGLSGLYISQSYVNHGSLASAPTRQKASWEMEMVEGEKVNSVEGKMMAKSLESAEESKYEQLTSNGRPSADSTIETNREFRYPAEYQPPVLAKPSAPSSSNSEVIASNTPLRVQIPLPTKEIPSPSIAFGNFEEYGSGFGGGGGGSDASKYQPGALAAPAQEVKRQVAISGEKMSNDKVIRREAESRYAWYSADEATKEIVKADDSLASSDATLQLEEPDVEADGRRAAKKSLNLLEEHQSPVDLDESKLHKLTQENPTSQDPYSTFSLRVSDASFQLAYHALQKGNRPQPEQIRSEDFYNAFDYGDAAASDGEPVVCAIEQSAHPYAPQRNLLRLNMAVGNSGRSAAQPLHLTLVVDQSGSMERDDRSDIMKAAVAELGKLLTEKDRVSVIGFSRTPRLLGENIAGNELVKWQALVTAAPNDGGTNLEEALQLGESLALRHRNAGAQNRILLITDGAANLGNADSEKLANQVKQMRQRGLCFDVVGVGTGGESDQRLLELSRNGNGRYQVLQNVSDAKETFARQLAGAFRPAAENVKLQVRFNDKRVKSFLLHGFEKDRLKTEDFRNDKVDAAEIAANEAGNALYQIQTIADGEGDVGEVSVRFRDPTTGMMIERKWTIPWQPAAPAFDRASPSMQLSGLALQSAQMLQGMPLAAPAMNPEFSEIEANVRNSFGNQVNVAKLLEMLRLLK